MLSLIREWIYRIKNYPLMEEVAVDNLVDHDEILTKQFPEVDDKQAWDNRWKQQSVFYKAPKKKLVVKHLEYVGIAPVLGTALDIMDTYNITEKDSSDIVPLSVMRWVENKFKLGEFKYKLDKRETWNAPEVTFKNKYGDCDDIGIMMYFIIREIFIQLDRWEKVRHRLKCVVGHVHEHGQLNAYAGLHFYLNWLYGDKEWYTVESTFYRDRAIRNFGFTTQEQNRQYGLICWTFNEYGMWSQKGMVVSNLDFKKKKSI